MTTEEQQQCAQLGKLLMDRGKRQKDLARLCDRLENVGGVFQQIGEQLSRVTPESNKETPQLVDNLTGFARQLVTPAELIEMAQQYTALIAQLARDRAALSEYGV